MARANIAKSRKPQKPHADYPLTPHASGGFCKKIKGRIYYFPANPDEALRQYLEVKDSLLTGVDPRQHQHGDTIADVIDAFLDQKQSQLDAGELSKRSFDDYYATCKRLLKFFGKGRRLATLGPLDFAPLKTDFQKTWGHVRVNNEIGRVRVVLKFAYDMDIIDRPVKTGPGFKKPSKQTLLEHRKRQPKKYFSAEQINLMLDAADVQMRAMILLGVNAAYSPSDIGRLQKDWIDGEWLAEHRGKTGEDRQAWLWPETREALETSLQHRPEPKNPEDDGCVFLTKYGNRWFRDECRHSPLSTQFTELTKRLGIHQKFVGFNCLRHVTETEGGNSRDQVAVDIVLGHKDNSMSANYRESIDPQRIVDVCEHVRSWLLGGAS